MVTSKKQETHVYELKKRENISLRGVDVSVVVDKFRADAVLLRVVSSGEQMWISNKPVFFSNEKLKGFQFSLTDIYQREVACLRAVRDPGITLIYYGTLCMLIGFGVIFLISHRQIWINVRKEDDKNIITIVGAASKNLRSFEHAYKRICGDIKKI